MVRRLTICLSLALAVTRGAIPVPAQKGGPTEVGRGSTAAARKYLEGRWSLVSFEVFPPERPPMRINGSGMLVYDAFGNLNVEIRVDPETASLLDGVGIPSTKGRVSTSGRVAVDMQSRTLTYFLEGQRQLGARPEPGDLSGPLALSRPRHWQVNGNELTLTTKGDDGQPASVAVWQKMH